MRTTTHILNHRSGLCVELILEEPTGAYRLRVHSPPVCADDDLLCDVRRWVRSVGRGWQKRNGISNCGEQAVTMNFSTEETKVKSNNREQITMSDLTPEQRIDNIWTHKVLPFYRDMERHRLYATTPDSKRFMAWLWRACAELEPENPAKLFKWSLETLADECAVNVLQPLPPNELKPPEPWRDLWGKPLPNPWMTKDLKSQSLLTQRDRRLLNG
jgi:hypothetical protein